MLQSLRRWLNQGVCFQAGDPVLYRSRRGQEQVCRFVQADDNSDVMLVECTDNSFWVKRHQVQPLAEQPLLTDPSNHESSSGYRESVPGSRNG